MLILILYPDIHCDIALTSSGDSTLQRIRSPPLWQMRLQWPKAPICGETSTDARLPLEHNKDGHKAKLTKSKARLPDIRKGCGFRVVGHSVPFKGK